MDTKTKTQEKGIITENSSLSPSLDNERKGKVKMAVGASLIIPHTIFWLLLESYSDKLYAFMVSSILALVCIYRLQELHPKLGSVICTIFLGIFSPIMIIILPEYSILAICINFMCVAMNVQNMETSVSHILPFSNVIGWILSYSFYQHVLSKYFDVETTFIFKDSSHLLQLSLGIVLSYTLYLGQFKHKKIDINIRRDYKLKQISLDKDLEEANAKLKITNKELEEALQEKDNFTLRFSHEIRNPLNSLLGNVELSYECVEDENVQTMLKEAKISGEILLQLINNVLDTAKLSSGRLDISTSPQEVGDFFVRSWVVCSEIIRKKGLYGSLSVNVDMPEMLEFDHHRVMQILINTISNAVKFTDLGFVKVFVDFKGGNQIEPEDMKPRHSDIYCKETEGNTIEDFLNEEELKEAPKDYYNYLNLTKKIFAAEKRSFLDNKGGQLAQVVPLDHRSSVKKIVTQKSVQRPRPDLNLSQASNKYTEGYIRIEVVDTGCGMSKKDLEALFKKFSQVHEQSSKRQIGTGLGLWITKEIIELMKGKIEISSVPNHGTTVVIMLKSTHSVDMPMTAQIAYSPSNRSKAKKFVFMSGKRALIVEDIPYNREVNRRLLEKCSISDISTANDGKMAFELFKTKGEGYFDVIFMDIDMPVMDGKTSVKLMRQHEMSNGWKPSVIIFLTAFSESKIQSEVLDKSGKYRANAFLSKPASFMTLFSTMKQIFERMLEADSGMQGMPKRSNKRVLSRIEPIQSQDEFILVVDDDSFNLSMLSKMLQMCGYVPLEAKNGKLAVDLYEKHWKDIKMVLMDCEMPVMCGFEATKEIIKKNDKRRVLMNKEIEIYGLTGHVGAEYRKKCLEVGMKGVMEKPITVERLRSLIKDGLVKN